MVSGETMKACRDMVLASMPENRSAASAGQCTELVDGRMGAGEQQLQPRRRGRRGHHAASSASSNAGAISIAGSCLRRLHVLRRCKDFAAPRPIKGPGLRIIGKCPAPAKQFSAEVASASDMHPRLPGRRPSALSRKASQLAVGLSAPRVRWRVQRQWFIGQSHICRRGRTSTEPSLETRHAHSPFQNRIEVRGTSRSDRNRRAAPCLLERDPSCTSMVFAATAVDSCGFPLTFFSLNCCNPTKIPSKPSPPRFTICRTGFNLPLSSSSLLSSQNFSPNSKFTGLAGYFTSFSNASPKTV